MCGVFGFVASEDRPVNMSILERIAKVTERRGPDAWGMAWIDRRGRLFMYKQSGRVRDSLGLLAMASDAVALIGHTRYATQGAPENNLNNHPHPSDGGWVVHNGVIPDYQHIARQYELNTVTDCDSEVLGLLIAESGGSLLQRCTTTAEIAGSRALVMLGLWKPGNLVAVRNGNPLHVGRTKYGTYLASLVEGLPGKVEEFADGKAREYKVTA